MNGVTWEYMFGRPFDGQLVDLRKKKNAPALAPAVSSLRELLKKATVKPATPSEAWGKGAVTAHNAGAAVDIYYHKNGDRTRAYANGLLSLFIQNRAAIKWGSIEYNQMEFSPVGIKSNAKDTEHFNHIHIDWIDYSRVVYSMAFSSFPYIDNDGSQKTKQVGPPGQRMEMYWNDGATSGSFTQFETGLDQLNRNFESLQADLVSMTTTDFQRLYGWDPRCTLPNPDWLVGWWEVRWRNDRFYYLFDRNGSVRWTQVRPPSDTRMMISSKGLGACSNMTGNLSILWTTSGSVERFEKPRDGSSMKGTWNETEPLTANKMW